MSLSLTNPFFSQLKKRILMMTRNPSKRRALAKYALAVPIFLILTLLLASPKTKVMASTEAVTEKVVSSIETLEKDLTAPKSLDTDLTAPTDVLPSFNDTTIMGTPQMVFTLDGNTPSSTQVMTLQEIHNRDKFSMHASVKRDNEERKLVEMFGLTIVRIARQSGKTTKASNTSMVFTKEMKDLVKMAEIGDTYQFIGHGRVEGEREVINHPFTYYIGDRAVQPRLETLSPQEQVELKKISESPFVVFGGKRSRSMIAANDLSKPDKLEAFQVVNGTIIPILVQSFILARQPFTHKEAYGESYNVGAQLNWESQRLLALAAPNDIYQFREIKCRIRGGSAAVNAEELSFIVEGTPPQYFVKKDSIEPIFATVDDVAEYTGGRDSMFRFLGRNIKYPAEARKSKLEGTIYLGFVVEKDGSLTDIKVKKNIPPTAVDTIQSYYPDGKKAGGLKIVTNQDETCAEEAMRVVKMMPKWKPAKHKGTVVRSSYVLPIKFKLE
jgi:hypothetical protein